MKRKNNFLKMALISAGLAVALLLALEGSLRMLGKHRAFPKKWFDEELKIENLDNHEPFNLDIKNLDKIPNLRFVGLTVPNTALAYKILPNQKTPHVHRINGETIFSTTISSDENGLRRTVDTHSTIKKKSMVAFWGGSRTFGWGVPDEHTLPSFFQELNPSSKVYNFAIPGDSPQFFLKALKIKDLSFLTPSGGTFYYVFDPNFDFRTVGGSHAPWVFRSTFYEINDENKLIEYSSFYQAHPFLSRFYKWSAQSALLQNLQLKFPVRFSDDHCKLIGRIFAESNKIITEKFAAKLKIVFFFTTDRTERILTCLQNEGLSNGIIQIGSDSLIESPESYYYLDGHPKMNLLKHLANLLNEF